MEATVELKINIPFPNVCTSAISVLDFIYYRDGDR